MVRLPRVRSFVRMMMQERIPDEGFHSGGAAERGGRKWGDQCQANNYWSGTEFSANNAWNFNFNNGNQNANNKDNNNFAWAVRSGA